MSSATGTGNFPLKSITTGSVDLRFYPPVGEEMPERSVTIPIEDGKIKVVIFFEADRDPYMRIYYNELDITGIVATKCGRPHLSRKVLDDIAVLYGSSVLIPATSETLFQTLKILSDIQP